jgi:hypothetical protein
MRSDHAIIIALIVVLIAIVAYQGNGWMSKSGCGNGDAGKYDTYAAAKAPAQRERYQNPYTTLEKMQRTVQGSPDGPKLLKDHRNLIPNMARSSASATPEQLYKAERASWFAARDARKSAGWDPEKGTEIGDQIQHEHATEPGLDWQDSLIDLIADPRLRENQRKWNAEMDPFNSTWLKVDDSDEITMYGLGIPRQGIAYAMGSAPPPVYNPFFLTELDPTLASVVKPFRFQG